MDIMPFLLLMLFSVALAICLGIILRVCRHPAQLGFAMENGVATAAETISSPEVYLQRPSCWLAVKSGNLLAVKRALGLQKAKPCSWIQGLCREEKLFISPPVKGWILVFGSDLPDPAADVDACFRFVMGLSRRLGHVQLFLANRVLQHHAWIRAEKGRVMRAYAWAGQTLWTQGATTLAEQELDMLCLDYCEGASGGNFGPSDPVVGNIDKVPALAARWSIDPGRLSGHFLEAEFGLAGEPCLSY
jgi:hypothetical protein